MRLGVRLAMTITITITITRWYFSMIPYTTRLSSRAIFRKKTLIRNWISDQHSNVAFNSSNTRYNR